VLPAESTQATEGLPLLQRESYSYENQRTFDGVLAFFQSRAHWDFLTSSIIYCFFWLLNPQSVCLPSPFVMMA
jgi:hypothetical protein